MHLPFANQAILYHLGTLFLLTFTLLMISKLGSLDSLAMTAALIILKSSCRRFVTSFLFFGLLNLLQFPASNGTFVGLALVKLSNLFSVCKLAPSGLSSPGLLKKQFKNKTHIL